MEQFQVPAKLLLPISRNPTVYRMECVHGSGTGSHVALWRVMLGPPLAAYAAFLQSAHRAKLSPPDRSGGVRRGARDISPSIVSIALSELPENDPSWQCPQ
jgi:hypothetical protein